MRFLQATNFRIGRGGVVPTLAVIHRSEAPLTVGTAWAVANYFHNQTSLDPNASSAHYAIDPAEIVGCVAPTDTAWHAGNANQFSVGYELAGYAADDDWATPPAVATLTAAAAQIKADLAVVPGWTPTWLTAADLTAGRRTGITDHHECVVAFGGDHTCPGPFFDGPGFADAVGSNPTPPPLEELDMDNLLIVHDTTSLGWRVCNIVTGRSTNLTGNPIALAQFTAAGVKTVAWAGADSYSP